jgi:hypothetical protein
MKCLTAQQANTYLQSIDMKLDDWNKITDISEAQHRKHNWINFRPQREELINFSHHVSGWLPKGNWKMFQIDNSTGWMDPVQLSFFGGLIWGVDNMPSDMENQTFLFEFGKDKSADDNSELVISNLIFTFLFFESHGYVVSSNSSTGQLLGVQDGYIYFLSRNTGDISNAKSLLENFKRAPSSPPQWVTDIYIERQELSLGDKS